VEKIRNKIQRLIYGESGQGMVEYILISVAVVLGCYFLMWVIADLLVRSYNELAAHVCLPIP
jgi:Flp pilus assembly pilin Flp